MKVSRSLFLLAIFVIAFSLNALAAINTTTYPFTSSAGIALEDMTGATGFTGLTAGNIDDTASAVTTIPFAFTLDGTSYTQFSVNANGLMRLGATAVGTTFSNSLASTADNPKVVAIWDDLCTSSAAGGGTVQYKVVGSAPNRKLVVEWKNMKSRTATCSTLADNTLTFQVWLNESSNRIDFVYGNSITLASFSTGFATGSTNFASVTTATPSVSYATANNSNTATPASGTQYSFIPPSTVQLSSATYSTNENAGSFVVTVQRGGNTTGTSSVDYATSDGTATAGADYTAASGTLNFAVGETSKTFSIPILTDFPLADPNETVNITLSNCVGCNLGTPSSSVLTIADSSPPLNGTYSVPGDYTSLTNAGGIFEALNANGASGPVTINITADLTGETGTNAINPIVGSPAVTIKPSGGARNISGTATIAVIRINGADNITINGSTTAPLVGGTPALRELTVQNNSTLTSSGVIALHSNTDGANNNTIKNVNVIGNDPTTTLAGISSGGATVGSLATVANNNLRVENCSLQKSIFGITSIGVAPATLNTGTVITQNDLSATGANRIRRVGVYVTNENGTQITENSIGGIDNTGESADAVGIAAGLQGILDNTTTTSGGVINAMIARNKVNGVSQDNTFSGAGIIIAGITGGTNTIANNMVSGVISDGDSGDMSAGIFVTGVTGSTTKLYYNSVAMTGDRSALLTPSTIMNPSFALAISGTDPIVELKNNIFYTSQIATGGGADATSYGIGMQSAAFTNLDSNYNAFYSIGTNDGGFRSGSLDRAVDATTEVDYAALAAWQGAVSDDANSQEGDPIFVNPSNDLHLNPLNIYSSVVYDKGTAVSVLDDIDGQIRSAIGRPGEPVPNAAGVPDIGADELLAPTAAGSLVSGKLLTPSGRGLANAQVVLTDVTTGQVRYARSGSFGYFSFEDCETGHFYILDVPSRKYRFNQTSFTLSGDLTDLVLTANP